MTFTPSKIILQFKGQLADRSYEAEGDYSIYVLLEELLHRLTWKEDGNDSKGK